MSWLLHLMWTVSVPLVTICTTKFNIHEVKGKYIFNYTLTVNAKSKFSGSNLKLF
jgi:chemotaxis protein CheY-P-specific phosphatase CheC